MDSNWRNRNRPELRPRLLGSILLGCIFLLAVWGCGVSEQKNAATAPAAAEVSRIYKFTSDTSHYYSTSHEGKFVASSDLLNAGNLENIPLRFSGWEGEKLVSDDPNILYLRYYESAAQDAGLFFVAVHGTNESQFHTPEVCYIGEGWKVEERDFATLELRDERFEVRYALASRDDMEHLILYWYLWPDSTRNITDGMTMLRVSVMIEDTIEAAEKAAIDFITGLSRLELEQASQPVVAVPTPVLPEVAQAEHTGVSEWTPHKEKALAWLKSQTVPNDIVREPVQERRHLLISYRVPEDSEDYPYVFSKASLYDNALAVLAFSMTGEYGLAERVIEAASRLLTPEGDLWFSFNTHNSWPNARDHSGAIIRSGASAWLGYAIVHYLKTRLVDNPDFLKQDQDALTHLNTAKKIADQLLTRQVLAESDRRFGMITGGEGSYSYRWNETAKRVEEFFTPGSIDWVSIEHNIDIFFFLRDLARLSGNKIYATAAERLQRALIENAWNPAIGQLNRGQRLDGPDPVQALDCASWGAMFLAAVGERAKAETALKSSLKFVSGTGSRRGHKPYRDLLLYEDAAINQLFYPEQPSKNWDDVSLVWPEGSLGVAMAHIKLDQKPEAKALLESMLALQDETGALPYATESLRFQFSTNPSVAGTAWLVMAIAAYEQDRVRDLFWER